MNELLIGLALIALVLAALTVRRSRALLIDPAYGCLTRPGLERIFRPGSDVIFLDLDGVHLLNVQLGMPEVDRRVVARSAPATRRGEIVAGRWYSGDELILLAPAGVGRRVAERLSVALADVGMSACIAVLPAAARLDVAAAAGLEVVAAQKAQRGGGELQALGR